MKNYLSLVIFLCSLCIQFSCSKEYLEKKPNKELLIPTTYEDFQALLDNMNIMNVSYGLGQIASDDFYNTNLAALSLAQEKNAYIWADDIYDGSAVSNDWDTPYQQIFYANIVLDGIGSLENKTEKSKLDFLKGSALFYRGLALFNLVQQFAPDFFSGNPLELNGLPIRLTSNVNYIAGRSSLEETYSRIILDLEKAAELLPERISILSRPNKLAAFGVLARVFLLQENYDKAKECTTNVLTRKQGLLDYNMLDSSKVLSFAKPFTAENSEIIFYSNLGRYSYFTSSKTFVDTLLYALYDENDLRKYLYYRYAKDENAYSFKGTYTGDAAWFSGIALDEIYLIRAESFARLGNMEGALGDMVTLMGKRFITGTYTRPEISTQDELIEYVLNERRKSLIGRGLRWSDIRRLNRNRKTSFTIKRVIDGKEYILEPGSPKYVFPIPEKELLGGHIEQNIR